MNYTVQIVTAVFSRFHAQTTSWGRGMMLLFAIVLVFAVVIGEGVLYHVSYFLALVIVGSYVYARLRLRRLDIRTSQSGKVGEATRLRVVS